MVAPVWEKVGATERAVYEREHGVKPAGYRGTGKVEWFAPWHDAEGPCWKCGTVTDRFVIGPCLIEKRAWGGETYRGHVFCAEVAYAFCWPCERTATIAVLEQRQQNPELWPELKANEAAYLAELAAETEAEQQT